MSSRICYLKCVKNAQKVINLPHLERVTLGRNEETGITDIHVSRRHLEIVADHENEKITLKTLGKCHAGCNGYALIKDSEYSLKNGDRIEVRLGFHQYDVVLESANGTESPPNKKLKLELEETENQEDVKFLNSGKWDEIDGKELLIYTSDDCKSRTTIAAFDLDGTLIKTKSGARFPKDHHDWNLNFGNVASKLRELSYEKHHKLVVFTNQSGVGKDSTKIRNFKEKVEQIVARIAAPMQIFIATGKSIYRKPAPGMWKALEETRNEGLGIDSDRSFFVGDAAGREKNWAPKKNKDHSIADRLFALNLGLKFYTPEEYFLKSPKIDFKMPEFDPRLPLTGAYPEIDPPKQEVIVMVGAPGSGKSHYCKSALIPKGYVHVSRDKLGSWQKCVKMLSECVERQQSVVVDNTNPDVESRQRFLDVAKANGVDCRCFVMETTLKHSKHNNKFRELTDKTHVPVSDIIINSFNKNYQEPKPSEGFSEIVKIPFVVKFDRSEHEKLYQTFLLES